MLTGDGHHKKSKTIQQILSIIETFPEPEDRTLLLDAMDSSKLLSMIQMMKVVRIIFHKAMESTFNAHSMTWLSFLILEKDKSRIFLESLLACCREWFSQRALNKKDRNRSTEIWEAYTIFLREMYTSLNNKKSGVYEDDAIKLKKHSHGLANLLLDVSLSLIHPKAVTETSAFEKHLEAVMTTLRAAGSSLNQDNQWKMNQLMNNFRILLLSDNEMSSISRKNLMEVIEYRSSEFVFDQHQQVYYFPYTK
jgi:hypothetical protein